MRHDRELAAIGARQHGLITREQALRFIDSTGLTRRLRAGMLVRVHPGVYRFAAVPITWEQRLLAGQLAAGPDALVSHRSAAALWDLAEGFGEVVEITVPAPRRPRLRHVVVHRSTDLRLDHGAHRRGISCTNPMRTVVDLGAVCPRGVVAEALERALVARRFSVAAAEAMVFDRSARGRDGVGVARQVLDLRALRTAKPDSTLEPRMARIFVGFNLPPAEFQHVVRDPAGVFVARVDFAYPWLKLAIEVDGFAVHGTPAAMRADFVRQNRLSALGWHVLRFTWHQVVLEPAKVAAAIADVLRAHASAYVSLARAEAVRREPNEVCDRRRDMRWFAVVVLLVVAACGGDEPTPVAAGGGDDDTVYEANVTVLESPEHGPELCLGGVAESYPPQCGGVPITNWDWERAPASESANGTTWGSYHVVGTYDGEAFTLTEDPGTPRPRTTDEGEDPFATPCPEPEGGWPETTAGQEAVGEVNAWAEQRDEFAGLWIDNLGEPREGADTPFVLNVRTTGDVGEWEDAVRQRWDGPLCVERFEHSHADLLRAQQEVHEDLDAQVSSVNVMRNRVEVQVTVVEPGMQERLDDRYGEGVVVLDGALRPVE